MAALKLEIDNQICEHDKSVKPCKEHCISIADIVEGVVKLKRGKHDGNKGYFSDHIINGTPKLYTYVSLLFNSMLAHGCVPNDFLISTLVQSHSRRRYIRCALGRLHFAHRRAEVRRSRITPDYFEDKRALIFSRRRRRDRAHSRARGCFEHMDFPEMCKLKCCESALVKIATKLRKQRAN